MKTKPFFPFFYKGKVYDLPVLFPYELRVIRHIRDNPGESRIKNADRLNITYNSLSTTVAQIYFQWNYAVVPATDYSWNNKNRIKFAIDVLEVYDSIFEVDDAS